MISNGTQINKKQHFHTRLTWQPSSLDLFRFVSLLTPSQHFNSSHHTLLLTSQGTLLSRALWFLSSLHDNFSFDVNKHNLGICLEDARLPGKMSLNG